MLGTSRDSLNSLISSLTETSIDDSVIETCRQLFDVCTILDDDKALRSAIADSGQTSASRESLMSDLFASKVSPLCLKVLTTVAANRWSSERDVIEALEELAARLLFKASLKKNELDSVEQELFRIARLVQTNS